MAYIELTDIHKSYIDANSVANQVLDCVSLNVDKGEFVSVFGPNGCGKTTLFNTIAGLIEYDSGEIRIDGKNPQHSRIGFVFQKYSESLFPWLRNVGNIAFGLSSSQRGAERHQAIRDFVVEMGLGGLPLDKYPYQCSAGQQQLVALAREIIGRPDVLLMDEPFVSLDYDRRIDQQEYLLRTWHRTGVTILFISHELDEAIYLADRLILMSQRPAKVVASFEIELPRPRTLEMLESAEFFDLKIPILRAFREIIGK